MLLASLVFMFIAAIQQTQASTRKFLTIFGVILVGIIFYLGHIDPSTAYISPEGLFFFNLSPLMQMLYIFGLAFAALPAIDLVAAKFTPCYSALVRYGFIAEVIAGIMLITSKDSLVLYITGWIIGMVYIALWTTLLFSKKSLG